MTAAAAHEGDIVPTTCSETIEHEDGPRAPTPTSPCLLQGTACGAAGEDQDEVIFIPSDSESESECEADEDVPSLKATNGLIDKETTVQLHSTSPASTMTTVPNTPRAVESGLEVDDDLNGAVQHSISLVSLTTSVSPRQEPRDDLNSSRCSPSLSATEVAEQDQGQVEDANESVSSHCGHHEADDRAELPPQTQPHESASQNVLAANDPDGHTTDVGDFGSDGGGDGGGNDDDYDDDRSSRDTDEEDDVHSKKRGTDRSSSVNQSDNGHADDPPDDNTEESPPRPHKRQKVTHDREDMTPARHQNSLPRFAGRAPRSPGRPRTASMLSPPASHSLSESESDEGSDCSKASAASFGEWLLKNAALKCVTIDGVATYQLQFQQAQAHSSSRRRETRPQGLVKSNKGGGRKPRDETKGRMCGICKKSGHNARTCQEKETDTNRVDLAR
ncbi:hypothetical protein BBO_08613 [Beauveria brongniartii RCEF 3172]|uniref:Uncharacterized protein n=1 Tax=Beauveria brongniartii RCEF 3172 TaxID=1081107 RepID=A0A166X9Y3_9HYPO|nr:hypothetical protein BBO_08613 [Beauveria brongniartii RCEF 3172]